MENLQTTVNEMSAKRTKGLQSPALERTHNLNKEDVQRTNMNESQSEYLSFNESHPIFKTNEHRSRLGAETSQQFLNTMSSMRKYQ